jgi:hypothetical protein
MKKSGPLVAQAFRPAHRARDGEFPEVETVGRVGKKMKKSRPLVAQAFRPAHRARVAALKGCATHIEDYRGRRYSTQPIARMTAACSSIAAS